MFCRAVVAHAIMIVCPLCILCSHMTFLTKLLLQQHCFRTILGTVAAAPMQMNSYAAAAAAAAKRATAR